MNDNNLASDKFSYKAAWQGAKGLCAGVRLKFFCMLLLFVVCGAIVLFGVGVLLPYQELEFWPAQSSAYLLWPKIIVALMLIFSIMLTLLLPNVYKLFFSRIQRGKTLSGYKSLAIDCVVFIVTLLCGSIFIGWLGSIILPLLGHVFSPPVSIFTASLIIFIVELIALGFIGLMFVHRVYTGDSWLKVIKFAIMSGCAYTFRWLVLILFCVLMLFLFTALMLGPVVLFVLAFMFFGEASLHEVLRYGLGSLIVIAAQSISIAVPIFIFLRYYNIVLTLPWTIYLLSYTTNIIKTDCVDIKKDSIWYFVGLALLGMCFLAFVSFFFLALLATI